MTDREEALGVDELEARVRAYIEGHQIIVDGPDETFSRELAPSAREPLAALSALAARAREMQGSPRQGCDLG